MLHRLTLSVVLLVVGGCAQFVSERGVEVTWNERTVTQFERGVTTRTQVLNTLGPPSQVVAMGDESVLYYLNESSRGQGFITFVYNRFELSATYDRAVFIFGPDGILNEFSTYIARDE
ncbi:MAG: hypothetical protein AAF098_04950 [Pseudomonadota bacterium]